jgi:hypothetical protein
MLYEFSGDQQIQPVLLNLLAADKSRDLLAARLHPNTKKVAGADLHSRTKCHGAVAVKSRSGVTTRWDSYADRIKPRAVSRMGNSRSGSSQQRGGKSFHTRTCAHPSLRQPAANGAGLFSHSTQACDPRRRRDSHSLLPDVSRMFRARGARSLAGL